MSTHRETVPPEPWGLLEWQSPPAQAHPLLPSAATAARTRSPFRAAALLPLQVKIHGADTDTLMVLLEYGQEGPQQLLAVLELQQRTWD